MINPRPDDLRLALVEFSRFRAEHLTGDEKGEAQIYCDRLFKAFGHLGVREAGATLEMRLKKQDATGTAFADLMWKPRCLIEMKKAGTDLSKHYRQAFDYWVAAVPDRPRYVVLCNFDEFWVYDFDNQLDAPVDRVRLTDLPHRSDALAFLLPQPAAPVFGNDLVAVTREAAAKVALLFREIHDRGVGRVVAQRFVLQSVMAMFAEDIGLTPGKHFTRAIEDAATGADAYDLLFGLFREMNSPGDTPGGRYFGTPYFNGGLFSQVDPIELTTGELGLLRAAAVTDWSAVRPEIFGTLFEGSMDAGERHAQGAHFTSQADIAKVVIPTIVAPWRRRLDSAGSIPELEKMLADLYNYRVLDPACGSGNFLYVAYRELRRIENDVLEAIADRRRSANIAAQSSLSYVSADHFYGMDINPFAVEVAKVTMMLAKKLSSDELEAHQEVLPLDNLDSTIVARDALFSKWPAADAIIGNPPYLGRRKMVDALGPVYTAKLATAFPNVGGVSDFVSYWFPLAHDHLLPDGRAGLVATNSIRQNETRKVTLDYILGNGGFITEAVASQPWSGDAAVHVSIVNWVKGEVDAPRVLWLNDGQLRLETDSISSSLSPAVDVHKAHALAVNQIPGMCQQGQTPGVTDGFVLDATELAALRLQADQGAIHPFLSGKRMLEHVSIDRWVVDIEQSDLVEARKAAPAAMQHLAKTVLPVRREAADREAERAAELRAANPNARPNRHHAGFLETWWQLGYRRGELLTAIASHDRYIATSRVASEKRATVFSFVDSSVRPGDSLSVFTLDDDYSFGVLSSSVHRAWFEARCSTLETRLRYTSTTVWDSFPWPQAPSDAHVAAVSDAVATVLSIRADFLNRGVTLKAQYDALRQPGKSTLRDAHGRLDAAVMAAYGFADDDMLAQLLALNQAVHADTESARGPGAVGLSGARVTNYRLGGDS